MLRPIHIGQRLRFAPVYFEDVPMDITLYSSDFRTETFNVKLGKERQEILITTDFVPTYVCLRYS